MENKKVDKLIDRIEADFRELAEITGDRHISAFIVDGSFFLMSYGENNDKKVDIYRKGGADNGKDS